MGRCGRTGIHLLRIPASLQDTAGSSPPLQKRERKKEKKMTLMKKIGFAKLAVALAALTLSACQYKELEDESQWARRPAVTVGFEWDAVDSIPKGMRVAFYPVRDGEYSQGYMLYDLLNRDSVIRIAAGTYDVTAWNNDCQHVLTAGYSSRPEVNATTLAYSSYGLYMMESILDSIYNGQRLLDYPDYMVHANRTQVQILQDVPNQKVVLRPDSMVVTIDVHLGGIRGLENCKSIRGAINNMRGRRYMAFDNYTEESVAIAFEAFPCVEDSAVNARFWVFGIEPAALGQDIRTLVTFFWMRGGRVFLPLDVTDSFVGIKEDDRHVVIDLPDLDIDLNEYVKKQGLNVEVDDWNNEFQGITF